MSLLDTVKSAAGVATAADETQNPLMTAVLSMLSSQSGGLAGLVQQFTSKGLGSVVSSWVGTGPNMPITPEQLQRGFGDEQINAIAAKAGLSPDAAKTGLAQLLPQLVDRLTPDGQMPQGDLMSKGMELLKGKLL